MNIFENLNVSEGCFNSIISIIENKILSDKELFAADKALSKVENAKRRYYGKMKKKEYDLIKDNPYASQKDLATFRNKEEEARKKADFFRKRSEGYPGKE